MKFAAWRRRRPQGATQGLAYGERTGRGRSPAPCATTTGGESAPGAEQRQRSSPEAEPLVRRADRKGAARKRQKPWISPRPRLWAVPYTRLTPGQIPLSTQASIMRRLEPASIHADATMAEVPRSLDRNCADGFHVRACDRPEVLMKKGRARSCDGVRAPWPVSSLLLPSEIDWIDCMLNFESFCINELPLRI
jgi:hypothetical protein